MHKGRECKEMNIEKILASFREKRVMIVGDVMVDTYYFGKVERISPEAPVPIVAVQRKDKRLGGAANVALNIESLGAEAILCGLIGDDSEGKEFAQILKRNKISSKHLYASPSRPTTTKTRIIGNNMQLLRIDEESEEYLSEKEEALFEKHCLDILKKEKIDAIIFEDYDKGTISPKLIASLVQAAKKMNIPVTVDPKKRNFKHYKGVSLFKPNLKEMREGLKLEALLADSKELGKQAEKLRKNLDAEMLMVTMSEAGVLMQAEQKEIRLSAQVRDIADVSGAGDTVISVATLCLSVGLTPEEIAYISNMAGGIVCEYVGVVPINSKELFRELKSKGEKPIKE